MIEIRDTRIEGLAYKIHLTFNQECLKRPTNKVILNLFSAFALCIAKIKKNTNDTNYESIRPIKKVVNARYIGIMCKKNRKNYTHYSLRPI